MRRSLARWLALGAFFVAASLAFAACGGDSVPGNSVVKVDDGSITKVEFNHWIDALAKNQALQSGVATKNVKAPVPPDYADCIAQLRKTTKPVKGQPTPTAESLKAQCKTQYETLRDQVLGLLVQSQWIDGESKDQGVTPSAKDIDAEFAKQRKQSFQTDKAYKKFLADTGLSADDLKLQIRANVLITKLREKITKGKDKVSDKAIASYYAKNKSKFAQPERRDIRIVLTKSKAKAEAAKAALESGSGWKTVAKKYSTDQATKNVGGVLLAVTKGSQEKALDDVVFGDKTKTKTLLGPVKTQFGYYVVEVTKVSPASQQTEKQASPAIKQLLVQQQQDNALNAFSEAFTKKWKAKTVCRTGFKVAELCKNAKADSTTSTVDTTGTTTTG